MEGKDAGMQGRQPVRTICGVALWLGVVAATPACGDTSSGLPLADVWVLMDDAAKCNPGQQCVLTPEMPCLCPQAVTADRHQEVLDALAQVDCNKEIMQKCTNFVNPRCEGGRCVRDSDL
jgi:hypothetical protein